MGVVFLLVCLPAVVFMVATIAVFDGYIALGICAMALGVVGAMLRAAREWDRPGADEPQPRALGGVARVATSSSSTISSVTEVPADAARSSSERHAA
jgi:hypothetical protein